MPLGEPEQVRGELGGLGHRLGDLVDELDLVEEPRVDAVTSWTSSTGTPGPQRPAGPSTIRPSVGRRVASRSGAGPAVGQRLARPSGSSTPGFSRERSAFWRASVNDAADRHRLADALHRRRQGVVGRRELLEGEARHLDDDVVERRLEARRRLLGDVVGDLVEGVADRHLRGDLGDGEPGRLGGQGRGAGHPRVHLDDDDPAVVGVDGELDVAAAGVDPDLADDGDADVAQPLVLAVGEGEGRRHGDRVAGVDAHRVEVLDRADDDDVVGVVAHHLELVLLPAEDRLLEEDLGRSGWTAVRPRPSRRSSASSWAKPDPSPPMVNDGRTTTG